MAAPRRRAALLPDPWSGLACGLDEVGRGPLAGPLVAAAVVLDPAFQDPLLRDSKRLTPGQRAAVEPRIRAAARAIALVSVAVAEIDRHGIGWANRRAFEELIAIVDAPHYVCDGTLRLATDRPYSALPGGDGRVAVIAAASIVAKVHRDAQMVALHDEAPEYGWAQNKGYGTAHHWLALRRLGPTRHHRRSFLAALAQPELPLDPAAATV